MTKPRENIGINDNWTHDYYHATANIIQ